jgi:hypothetical protein
MEDLQGPLDVVAGLGRSGLGADRGRVAGGEVDRGHLQVVFTGQPLGRDLGGQVV